MKKLILIFTLMFCIGPATAAYWVDDPNNCPTSYLSQGPFSGQVVCGENSGTVYFYSPGSLAPPASNDTSISSVDDGTYDGGYLLDCYSYDGTSPHCDNSGSFWCDSNSSITSNPVYRQTICLADAFGSTVVGNCISGRYDCYGDTDCESTSTSACENSQNNHYSTGTCNTDLGGGASGTCVCDTNYYACDGSEIDTDGCEIQTGASCGFSTGTYSGSCDGASGDCTSSVNSDCNNDDSDGDLTTCNGVTDGCEITGGGSCGSGTGTYENSECLGTTGNCTSSGVNLDCNDDDSDSNELTCNGVDGCEVVNNSACSVGALSGTYQGCSAGVGNCVVSKSYFETGTKTSYSTADSLLWGVQYGGGAFINMTNANTNETFLVNGSGCIVFADNSTQCSAGSGAANLTNVAFVNESNSFSGNQSFDSNVSVEGYGFFGWLGSLGDRVVKLFIVDVDVSGDLNVSGNITLNGTTINDWSDVDTDTQKNATGYLYNDSTTIYLNETKLNETINALENDTTYSHLSNFTDDLNYSEKNVNSSTWWSGLSSWLSGWFVDNGSQLEFNETKLNDTISSEGVRLGFNSTYNATYDAKVSGIWINVSGIATYYGNANITQNLSFGTGGVLYHNGTELIIEY